MVTTFDGAVIWIKGANPPPYAQTAGDAELSNIVLCHWPNGWIGLGQYASKDGWYWVEQDGGEQADADPTHWMPLPEAPL